MKDRCITSPNGLVFKLHGNNMYTQDPVVVLPSSSDEEDFANWKAAQKSAQSTDLKRHLVESRQIRKEQDEEFAKSLAIDRLKVCI